MSSSYVSAAPDEAIAARHMASPRRNAISDDGATIMRRIQAGDLLAFDELYRNQKALVYRVALQLLGDAASAEDLMQSVFLKLWARPSAFPGGSFNAWISRVARNAAIDHTRRKANATTVELDVDLATEDEVFNLIVARLEEERLYRSLRTLAQSKRSLIELHFFQGQTHQEIAVSLDIPLGTVKTRIRAGLGWLRSALSRPASLASRRPIE